MQADYLSISVFGYTMAARRSIGQLLWAISVDIVVTQTVLCLCRRPSYRTNGDCRLWIRVWAAYNRVKRHMEVSVCRTPTTSDMRHLSGDRSAGPLSGRVVHRCTWSVGSIVCKRISRSAGSAMHTMRIGALCCQPPLILRSEWHGCISEAGRRLAWRYLDDCQNGPAATD